MMYIHKSEAYKYISPYHVSKDIKIYEFKVTLQETRPIVWRRIAVPAEFTLEQLGRTAAAAIGWIPRYFHLWDPNGEFVNGYDPYAHFMEDISIESNENNGNKEKKSKRAKDLIVSEIFNLTDKKTSVMDYGSDGWLHNITLVKIRDSDRKYYPKCTDGKNACPPEDCPPEQYKHLIKVMKDPKHKEHSELKEWLKDCGHTRFNPTKFNVSKVAF